MRAHSLLLFSAAVASSGTFACAQAAANAAPATVGSLVRQLIEVTVASPGELQQLMDLDLDLAGSHRDESSRRVVEVIGRPGDFARLQGANLQSVVRIPDLAADHATRIAQHAGVSSHTLTPAIGQGSMGGHYTLAEMEAILDGFHAQYPQICSQKISIGQSIEGRDLWMVKISDNVAVDENEPEVLYDSLHHAREPMSLGTTLVFMDELLSGFGTDPLMSFLVAERELYFVPCVNPDGYEYNRQTNPNGGGLWRKNRRVNGGGSFGVDLNRNYGTGWNAPNGGSSTNPNSDTYRGTAAFSEPETAAMEAFTLTRQFVQVFSTHCSGDILLRPWGYQNAAPANVADYEQLGDYLTEVSGNEHGSVPGLLYIASGGALDHHHAAHGSYAWTPELGRASEGGFWPVGPDIETIARRHQPMFRRLALAAGPAFVQSSVAVVEAAGGNGNQIIEPGETAEVVVTVINQGAAAAPLSIELQVVSPQIVLGNGLVNLGTVAAFATDSNAPSPLTFTVPANFSGLVASLSVRITGDGRVQSAPLEVPLAAARTCIDDDFEQDRGFARADGGSATTGLWGRGTPQATSSGGQTIQPGSQTTPGGNSCWVTDAAAGASVGANDVDSGETDLLSPALDLSHLVAAQLAFDLWFAESASNDALEVSISRDGGASWATIYSTSISTAGWQRLELPLGSPLTADMQLRVRAQDFNASLVEACVDGLVIEGIARDGATTVLGSGKLGTNLRIGGNGPSQGALLPLAAVGAGPGITAPGIGGTFLLDPATVATLPLAFVGTNEYSAWELSLPAQPGLIGLQLAFQHVVLASGAISFGDNAPTVTLH